VKRRSYTAPADSLRVTEGEFISPGDTLALVIGLWITLKISVMATIFGVIIGIISGLMRISDNPALQMDLHHLCGTDPRLPLLVQILIWYFVLGTLINDLLRLRIRPPSRRSGTASLPWPFSPAPT
jgi:polar amino acid transport system permease protein